MVTALSGDKGTWILDSLSSPRPPCGIPEDMTTMKEEIGEYHSSKLSERRLDPRVGVDTNSECISHLCKVGGFKRQAEHFP